MEIDALYLSVHKALEQAFLLADVELVNDYSNRCLVVQSKLVKSINEYSSGDNDDHFEEGAGQMVECDDIENSPFDNRKHFPGSVAVEDHVVGRDDNEDPDVFIKNEIHSTVPF